MLQLSKFPFKTLKTSPKVSDNRSTSILLQGGYIRQAMAGAYEFLPIGTKVLKNIEQVIREEMDAAGYHEMLMTILTPKEYWETTNRWEIPEYFKVPGWGNTEYRIAPTNEENVTPIMGEFIQSYKDLPTCVYHIQKKFRNEKRAKSGLLRGREFVMKDAYSFHASIEDFDTFYENTKDVYMKIFDRLGIKADTVIADADGGAISDKNSHEFQTFLEVGEDTIVQDSSGYCYNLELASGVADDKNISETENAMEYIDSVPEIVNMEKMTKYFESPAWQMLKTVIYKLDSGKFVGVAIRGDLDINEIKLGKFIRANYDNANFELANEADLETLGTVRGFISPLKDSQLDVDFYGDLSLQTVRNMFGGGNKVAKSTKNMNISDLDLKDIVDFNEPVEGFTSNNVAGEKLTFKKASEIGNIFHLGTKYSKPFKLSFLDSNNVNIDKVEMGCYGIGVSRLMGVMAEYFMSDKGIAWPEAIAPATHYIIVMGEQNIEAAKILATDLESQGKTVILDDRMGRKDGFGQKAGDCELFGVPNRIVLSPKTLEQGGYELLKRGSEPKIIKL
ncbi:proline--tRNA ligase [Candidatus Gracilibacteria bacterium]|nr:proline--tRNA ligase [Candidatus Gracilibacteria bacterium]